MAIKFKFNQIREDKATATVAFGNDSHPAEVVRDIDGHLEVTVDTTEPETGEQVQFTNHGENDSSYEGRIYRAENGDIELRSF